MQQESTEFQVPDSYCTDIDAEGSTDIILDPNEQKEIIAFKLNLLHKEEGKLKDELESLEVEKNVYLSEYKRISDEEISKFFGKQVKEKYQVLNDQYLLMCLLGKGGYSEVYKVLPLSLTIGLRSTQLQRSSLQNPSL